MRGYKNSNSELFIAVPYISSFAKSVLTEKYLSRFQTKKILTCFDEFNINSFDLDTLMFFIKNDIELRFNNDIHLKMYIFGNDGFISSSNLTKSGFENSIELTSSITKEQLPECKTFFNKLWKESSKNKITKELIDDNYSKYLLLKKRSNYKKPSQLLTETKDLNIKGLNIERLIRYLFNRDINSYEYFTKNAFEANKDRETIKERVRKGYQLELFYSPVRHKNRKDSLGYKLMYGKEEKIAGTGLMDSQFRDVFEHDMFPEIISYIYPPIVDKEDWNLIDDDTFREYCNGIFEFRIPQYKMTLPIRLASYFYPQFFLPIFKMKELEKVCSILGLKSNASSDGDKLFTYNKFLLNKLKSVPYDNYIKSNIIYQLYYTVELHEKICEGLEFEDILLLFKEKWKKEYIEKGKQILMELKDSST